MSSHAEIEVVVLGDSNAAVNVTVDPDGDYEQDLFIPHSCIEDLKALDSEDADGKCTISVAKWFLRKNNIPYESDTGWQPTDKGW